MTDATRRIVLGALLLGIAVMFAATVAWRLDGKPLVHDHGNESHQQKEYIEIPQIFYIIGIDKTFPCDPVFQYGNDMSAPGKLQQEKNNENHDHRETEHPLNHIRHNDRKHPAHVDNTQRQRKADENHCKIC